MILNFLKDKKGGVTKSSIKWLKSYGLELDKPGFLNPRGTHLQTGKFIQLKIEDTNTKLFGLLSDS